MSQSPITVTYDIKELFANLERKIDNRFDRLESEVKEIKADLAEVKGDVKGLEIEVRNVKENLAKLESKTREIDGLKESVSNLTGLNSFFKPVVVAIISGLVVALFRFIPIS